MVPADLDGDGAQDIIVSSPWPAPAQLAMLRGDSHGGFHRASGPVLDGAVHSLIAGLAVADFDADGRADAVSRTPVGGNTAPFPIEGRVDAFAGRAGADVAISASVLIAPAGSRAVLGELATGDADVCALLSLKTGRERPQRVFDGVERRHRAVRRGARLLDAPQLWCDASVERADRVVPGADY